MVTLTVLGRADVTGDGIDDLLLLANGGATEGTYGASRLYLLTWDGPDVVLRVIDAERELCPDYNCHPLPPDIAAYRDSSPPPSPEDIGGLAGPSSAEGVAEEESPPYPVWWSHGLGLEGLESVSAHLRRSFWSGMDLGIRVFKGSYDDNIDAEARNCVELEALTQAGYGLPEGSLHSTQMYHLLKCRTISLLGTVQPARESYLRDFAIDERGTRELLLAFGLIEQGDIPQQVSFRDSEMFLMGGLGKLLVVDLPYGGNSDVWAEKGRVRMRIEARGDFTGDGIEDLLFSAGARLSRYRPDVTDLCLITRETPDAPLRRIDVAPYSCQRPGEYDRVGDDRN